MTQAELFEGAPLVTIGADVRVRIGDGPGELDEGKAMAIEHKLSFKNPDLRKLWTRLTSAMRSLGLDYKYARDAATKLARYVRLEDRDYGEIVHAVKAAAFGASTAIVKDEDKPRVKRATNIAFRLSKEEDHVFACRRDFDDAGREILVAPRGALVWMLEFFGTAVYDDQRIQGASYEYRWRGPEPRDYQVDAVDFFIKRDGIVVMPCGAGKTLAALNGIARAGRRAVVLVPTKEIRDEWIRECWKCLGLAPGAVGDGKFAPEPHVTVAINATAVRLGAEKFEALFGAAGVLVVDECLPANAKVIVEGRGIMTIRDCISLDCPVNVMSFDHKRRVCEFRNVLTTSVKIVKRRFVTLKVRVKLRTLKLRLTEDHPVFINGIGYVAAKDVKESDHVKIFSGLYQCKECNAAFISVSALGGHVQQVHRGGAERARRQLKQGGGDCRYCGKRYSTDFHLSDHVRRHEDPIYDAERRRKNSAKMRATNLRRRDKISAHMTANNPTMDKAVVEKIKSSHKNRSKEWYSHLNGGNGRGPTEPEIALFEALGARWAWQHIVPTGGRGHGYPTHYKLDIANVSNKIAVEVDGQSHRGERAKERDARKDAWLRNNGWLVFRVWNDEAKDYPQRTAQKIEEAMDEGRDYGNCRIGRGLRRRGRGSL